MDTTLKIQATSCSPQESTRRTFLFIGICLVVGWTPSALLGAVDVWPLVNISQGAVWGTLTEIREGDVDRLLLVAVSGRADGRDTRGPDPLQLLTRAGRLPDGTPIRPGATGLFLFCRPIDESGEFGFVDGWLLHDGFRPMNPRRGVGRRR